MKYIILILSLCSLPLFGQKDPEAKKILDSFSKKTKSLKSYSASFEITSENKQTGESNGNKGTILIMGEMYKLTLNQSEIYFDGKNVYNFTPKSNEVSITKPGKKDDEIFQNPSKVFKIYEKDYKYRLLGEATYKQKVCYEIDLYPIDFNKKYSIVKLLIDKEKYELVAAKMIMKSGVNYTLEISNFNSNASAKNSDFSFLPEKHKGIEVIDLR